MQNEDWRLRSSLNRRHVQSPKSAMERRRVMRGPAVNTGPLFRAIKQFPCTHGIMFLLFSIGQTSSSFATRVLEETRVNWDVAWKTARNRGSRRQDREEQNGNGIDKIVSWFACSDSLPSSIDHWPFFEIATNPLRLESTRSLLDSCFSRFVTRIPRHFEIFQIESRIPDLGCRLVLAKAPSIARV